MWLKSKPWGWNHRAIYRCARATNYGIIRSIWLAITFPHVHEEEE